MTNTSLYRYYAKAEREEAARRYELLDAMKSSQRLIDDWCEINAGGVVTQDQLDEIERRRVKYLARAREEAMSDMPLREGQGFRQKIAHLEAENERLREEMLEIKSLACARFF